MSATVRTPFFLFDQAFPPQRTGGGHAWSLTPADEPAIRTGQGTGGGLSAAQG
jgi:hypothetical protein